MHIKLLAQIVSVGRRSIILNSRFYVHMMPTTHSMPGGSAKFVRVEVLYCGRLSVMWICDRRRNVPRLGWGSFMRATTLAKDT